MPDVQLPPLSVAAPLFLLVLLSVLTGVFDVIILSISFAVVTIPLHHLLSRAVRPWISAALITLTMLTGLIAAALITLTLLSENSGLMTEVIGKITEWVTESGTGSDLFGLPVGRLEVAGWLTSIETIFDRYWLGLADQLPVIAIKVGVFFSVLFILFLFGERVWEEILSRVPGARSPVAVRMTGVSVDTLYALYVIHIIVAVVTFFIAIPLFLILGYGHVLYFSFVCAVCELIPVLGSSVVMVFVGAYAVAIGDVRGVLITFIIGYIGVSVLPEIYLRPVLMGRRAHINPIVMFIGFIGGILLLGIAGFVLGPLVLVLLATWFRISRETAGSASPPATPGDG